MAINIRPLTKEDFLGVQKFADDYIGKNYFSLEDLERLLQLSTKNGQVSSLLAFDDQKLIGMRLSFMPGQWKKEDTLDLDESKWPHPIEDMAYFKSLFISAEYQGIGLGIRMSKRALEIFKAQGAKGVVTHSWMQSPNNSSYKYLKKLGFEVIREIPNAWSHIDYECVVCSPLRCHCSAKEMCLDLEKK